jgi:hypothetical protein
VARHVRQSLEGEDVPILKTALMERAAFRAIHLTGEVPRQTEPGGPAATNVSALAQEVLERLAVKEVGMTDFPSLKDELRPKPKLRRHEDPPITDEEIEANSRQLGQRWGASTSIDPPAAPASAPPPPAPPPPAIAPVVSIRGYIPELPGRRAGD